MGHCGGESERVADREDDVAGAQGRGAPEFDGGQIAQRDPEEREIGVGIATDDLRIRLPAVGELYTDGGGVGDDMVIGDDEAIAAGHETGALRGTAAWLGHGHAGADEGRQGSPDPQGTITTQMGLLI